jgi:hypothetical protein
MRFALALLACVVTTATGTRADFPSQTTLSRALTILGMKVADVERTVHEYATLRTCYGKFRSQLESLGVDESRLQNDPLSLLESLGPIQHTIRNEVNVSIRTARECILDLEGCGQVVHDYCDLTSPMEFAPQSLGNLMQQIVVTLFLPDAAFVQRKLSLYDSSSSLLGDTSAIVQEQKMATGASQGTPPWSNLMTPTALVDVISGGIRMFTQLAQTNGASSGGGGAEGGGLMNTLSGVTSGVTSGVSGRRLDAFGMTASPLLTLMRQQQERLSTPTAREFVEHLPDFTSEEREHLRDVLDRLDGASREMATRVFSELPPYLQQSLLMSAMSSSADSSSLMSLVDILQRSQLFPNLGKKMGLTQKDHARLRNYAAGDGTYVHDVLATVVDRHFPVELKSPGEEAVVIRFLRTYPANLRVLAILYDWVGSKSR